jgi:hypothetical protein
MNKGRKKINRCRFKKINDILRPPTPLQTCLLKITSLGIEPQPPAFKANTQPTEQLRGNTKALTSILSNTEESEI